MQQALVARLADETGARLGGDHARHTVVALRRVCHVLWACVRGAL